MAYFIIMPGFIMPLTSRADMSCWCVSFTCICVILTISFSLWLCIMKPQSHWTIFISIMFEGIEATPRLTQAGYPRMIQGYMNARHDSDDGGERGSLDAPPRYLDRGRVLVFVREVMTRDVIVIDPDRTVLDAAKRMAAKKIGGLVVVQHGRPIGLITDRGIRWQATSKRKEPSKVLVRGIMTPPGATLTPLS